MAESLFENFPVELIELTLSFINSNKRRRVARAVCRKWHNIIRNIHFDIYLPLPSEVPTIAKTFNRCDQLFSLTVHKADNLNAEDYKELLCELNNMISFEMSFIHYRYRKVGSVELDQLTNLQKFAAPQIGVSIGTKLPHLTYLETSAVQITDPNCFPNLEYFSSNGNRRLSHHLVLPKLTTLKYVEDLFGPKVSEYTQNLKVFHPPTLKTTALSLPNLEDLKLSKSITLEKANKLTKLHIDGIKDFLPYKVATNLLELDVGYGSTIKENSLSFLTSFKQLNACQFWFGEYRNYSGDFMQFLNTKTLTRLVAGLGVSKISRHISKFTNLESLKLWVEVPADLESLSNLSRLTALTVQGGDSVQHFQWVSKLTSLQRIFLAFKSDLKSVLDLNPLTNLTSLHVHSLQSLEAMNDLTNLRRLDFATATEYTFISKLTKLTRLACARIAVPDQVTNLQKIRELDICFTSNDQIIALTGLQKLTYLMARTHTDDVRVETLTLLTRLQSVSFGSVSLLLTSVSPWSTETAVPEVAQKLPRLVYKH